MRAPPHAAGGDARSTRAPKPDEIEEAIDGARGRILSTAYDLFCQHGVQAIGIDRIVAEAGVAKMTLYRHFRSKDDLVVAVLDLREELWINRWVIAESRRRAETARGRLLVIFEMFDDWFRRADYEGCLFNNTLLEDHDPASPARLASIVKRSHIVAFLRSLAEEAGARHPDALARQWQMLMSGAMMAGAEGDVDAAHRARDVGALLLERELQAE
ncbi:MAG: TetR/AcrR family transcriptional regulator [Gaiellales bacterium]